MLIDGQALIEHRKILSKELLDKSNDGRSEKIKEKVERFNKTNGVSKLHVDVYA
jgi:hypothetical protein